jgi:hypothetical protein
MRLPKTLNRFLNCLAGHRPAAQSKKAPGRLALEALEDRTAPAVISFVGGVLTYTAGNNVANVLTTSYDDASERYKFTDAAETINLGGGVLAGAGSGGNSVSFSAANIAAIVLNLGNQADNVRLLSTADATTIHAGTGDDQIDVGGYLVNNSYFGNGLDSIRAPVNVFGGDGYDQLWVNDWADPDKNHYTATDRAVTRLGVGIGYDAQVDYVRLNEGYSHCTINVESTSAATALTVNLKSGGQDTVVVGGAAGSLDGIRGPVTVLGEVSTAGDRVDSLIINDRNDADDNTYTYGVEYYNRPDFAFPLVIGTLTRGSAAISFTAGLPGVTLLAGRGADTINVLSTAALAPLTVRAGAGDDTIRVGANGSVAALLGPLFVDGQDGQDRLSTDDRANGPDAFLIDAQTVRRNGQLLLWYNSVEGFEIMP